MGIGNKMGGGGSYILYENWFPNQNHSSVQDQLNFDFSLHVMDNQMRWVKPFLIQKTLLYRKQIQYVIGAI